jgi:hypothetical protein
MVKTLRRFTLQDYEDLPIEKQRLVDLWIKTYDLSTAQFIESVEGDSDDPLLADVTLVAYGPHYIKRFRANGELVFVYDFEELREEMVVGNEMTVYKMAEFEVDDFPWEVLDNG